MADQSPPDPQVTQNRVSANRFRVQCPKCRAFYRVKLDDYAPPADATDLNPDGSITIFLHPDACKHHFTVYLDAKLNARSTQLVHDAKVEISLIRSDPDNLLQKERDAIEKHNDAVARNVHAEIMETWQELKKIRKEITRLGLD
jgi:hypothetical protein